MSRAKLPPDSRDADLSTALALTEQLLAPGSEAGAMPLVPTEAPKEGLGTNLRHMLWKMGGRKRPELADQSHLSRIFDNYERELEQQRKTFEAELAKRDADHGKELDRIRKNAGIDMDKVRADIRRDADRSLLDAQRELAQSRAKASKLEQLTNQLQTAFDVEIAKARNETAAISEGPLQNALDRVEELTRRLKTIQADHAKALDATHASHAAALAQAEETAARAVAGIREQAARDRLAAEQLVAEREAAARRQVDETAGDLDLAISSHRQQLADLIAAHQAETARIRAELTAERDRETASLTARQAEIEDAFARREQALADEIEALKDSHRQELGALRAAAEEDRAQLEERIEETLDNHAIQSREAEERHIREIIQIRSEMHESAQASLQKAVERTEAREADLAAQADGHARQIEAIRQGHTQSLEQARMAAAQSLGEARQQAQAQAAALAAELEAERARHLMDVEEARRAVAATGDANLRQALDQLTQSQADCQSLRQQLLDLAQSHAVELARRDEAAKADQHADIQALRAELAEAHRQLEQTIEAHQGAIEAIRAQTRTESEALAAAERQRADRLQEELAAVASRHAAQLAATRAQGEADKDRDHQELLAELAAARSALSDSDARHAQDLADKDRLQAQTQTDFQRKLHDQASRHADLLRQETTRLKDEAKARIASLDSRWQDQLQAHQAELERVRQEAAAISDGNLRQALDKLAAVQAERRDLQDRLSAQGPGNAASPGQHFLQDHVAEKEAELARTRMAHARDIAAIKEQADKERAEAETRNQALADEVNRLRDLLDRPATPSPEASRQSEQRHHEEVDHLRRQLQSERTEMDMRLSQATERIAQLEADHARLRRDHARDLERAQEDMRQSTQRHHQDIVNGLEADLAAARRHVADLETRQAGGPAKAPGPAGEPDARLNAALARAMMAEDELRIANNKIELLKDALDAAKARAVSPGPGLVDNRFRDAKRAFARHFHPDQGGKGDTAKATMFLDFWPILEKIDRGGDF